MLLRHLIRLTAAAPHTSPSNLIAPTSARTLAQKKKNVAAAVKHKPSSDASDSSATATSASDSSPSSFQSELDKPAAEARSFSTATTIDPPSASTQTPAQPAPEARAPKEEAKQQTNLEESQPRLEGEEEEAGHGGKDPRKAYRIWGFRLLRGLKVVFWLNAGYFTYHMILLKYHQKPHLESPGTSMRYFNYSIHFYNFLHFLMTIFTRPPVRKLLPDKPQPPPGYQTQKTLVLNLNGTILHSEYKLGVGFELIKRPGLSVFLSRLARNYEIVIFADVDHMTVTDVIEAIDPMRNQVMIGFGRESTVLENGEYIKDMRYLNRNLKDVIVVEADPNKVKYQKENCIVLPLYTGDPDDSQLMDLLPLLEYLGKPGVKDVRKELQLLGEDPITKYKEVSQLRREKIRSTGVGSLLSGLTGGGSKR